MQIKETHNQMGETQPQAGKLYIENTLLRISGALFCHDPKTAALRTNAIDINRGASEKHIVIRPDAKLGQPGQLAHKIFIALLKKHSDYGRPIQKEISFTKREVMRLIGRKTWGGRDSEQLSRALHEIHFTFITTKFRNGEGRHVEHSFNVFPEILLERREFASDPIERCTITLAEPIVSSLRDEHFTCLNYAMMMRLGTIGQAIYMRLFFHFANLYDGRHPGHLTFLKRYDDLCAEWLGGLKVLEQRSKIVGEQLGGHLDQLVAERFLASYRIDKAKTRDGFVITFKPGQTFFEDYERFYRDRKQGELQFGFHSDRRDTSEPLRVAYLFAGKRSGENVGSAAFVPSKDVETAKQLLGELHFDEITSFIDYALREARKTDFDVRTLSGTKQYLAGYLAAKRHRMAVVTQEKARAAADRQEADLLAYNRDRRLEALRFLLNLPEEQRASIDAEAKAHSAALGGTLGSSMYEFNKARFVIARYGDRLSSFENWQAARKAA